MRPLPEPFPTGIKIAQDNPGLRLYGMRFVKDQSLPEFVAEFMLLLFSQKRIGNNEIIGFLPDLKLIQSWPNGKSLEYKVPIKLILKLFAFFSKTDIDKRHTAHEIKYKEVIDNVKRKIRVAHGKEDKVVEALEELFVGLLGAGAERNWCARTFYPLSECLLSQEVIWNETAAKKNKQAMELSWEEMVKEDNFSRYYNTKKHNFLARGGEELYLQLCNLFSQPHTEVDRWASSIGILQEYRDLTGLYASLNKNLEVLKGKEFCGLEKIADFIEELDTETSWELRNMTGERWLSCEWCPKETWPETLLFAIELNNLLSASIDPVERIEHVITACTIQVMRTLCAQSIRYFSDIEGEEGIAPLGYLWLMSPLQAEKTMQVMAADNLERIQNVIYRALRHPELMEWEKKASEKKKKASEKKKKTDLYKEADSSYGHGLFLSLGKRLGMIIPRQGPNARMVLNDRLVRYLVMSLLKPGEKAEYPEFVNRVYAHYGMAIEGEELLEAIAWSGHPRPHQPPFEDRWFLELLRKGGFLIELSDACSIVENPF